MFKLIDWFNDRTGVKRIMHEALYENIPFGARLRYASGSMLVFAFVTQMITGIFLWMAYSPSSQTAWESVYYIQYEMTGGWLLRGIHHFMASAMMVVLGLHLLQVIIDGAYKAPREVNYWLGLILMQIVMGLGLTGYLLPWDEKGYWATNVATNLMTLVPFVGKDIQQVVLGGSAYGHHTLTRFFALHAGVLPVLMMMFLGLHIAVFRRHGITPVVRPNKPDQAFWPYQVFWDALGCLLLLVLVLLCSIHFDIGGALSGNLPVANRGAELMAPADPSQSFDAARPEWYFLFLFQLLKYFDGSLGFLNGEFMGALVIPGIVMTVLAAAPILAYWKWGHRFNVGFVLSLIAIAGLLTGVAIYEDSNEKFEAVQGAAHAKAERAIELVQRRPLEMQDGELKPSKDPQLIPKEGAVFLVRNDPMLQGPALFKTNCASCHAFEDPHHVESGPTPVPGEEHTHAGWSFPRLVSKGAKVGSGAPNLHHFASREWLEGLLDPDLIDERRLIDAPPEPESEHSEGKEKPEPKDRVISPYFGDTIHRDGRMAQWVKKYYGEFPAKIAKAQETLAAVDSDLAALKGKDDDQSNQTRDSLGEERTKAEATLKEAEEQHKQRLEEREAIIAALSAQAQLPYQREADAADLELVEKGVGLMKQTCATYCHRVGDTGQLGLAPDLTGYGSYGWMLGLISDPTHERFYRNENDRMPQFAADLSHPATHTLSVRELSLIVDWLREDYYDPANDSLQTPHTNSAAIAAVQASRSLTLDAPQLVGVTVSEEEQLATKAERMFRTNCAGCHTMLDENGAGIQSGNPTAPNLHGFGSRKWLAGFLDAEQIVSPKYFGNTHHKNGDMVSFVDDNLVDLDEEQQTALTALIAALSAEAKLPAQAEADAKAMEDGLIEEGVTALTETFSCTDCHQFHDYENEGAPDLIGWGSQEWLTGMISNPEADRFYNGNNDRMPRFHRKGHPTSLLSAEDVDLLARWIRGERLSKSE